MNYEMYHLPEFENDHLVVLLKDIIISDEQIAKINDPYLNLKLKKFQNKDISISGFKEFSYKGSLKNLSKKKDLAGSIYTHKIQKTQEIQLDEILEKIRLMLKMNSRRAFLNFSNKISESYISESSPLDISCLCSIHYLDNKASIYFRASDILEELFVDIVTIYKFFLQPIYLDKINIFLVSSTCQNVDMIDFFLNKMKKFLD